MALAMAERVDSTNGVTLYVPTTTVHSRTLGLNKARLVKRSDILRTPNYEMLPYCHVMTAQLFEGFMLQSFRPDRVDGSSLWKLLDAVKASKPRYLVIGCALEFLAVDSGAQFHYLLSTLRGLKYMTSDKILNDHLALGLGHSSSTLWVRAWRRDCGSPLALNLKEPVKQSLGMLLASVCSSVGSKFTPKTALKFSQVEPGCSRKRETYRRLSFDEPCPKLALTSGKDALCHPTELRPLTVAEVKRVQGFPDDWQLSGTMREQYKQLIWSVNPRAAEIVCGTIPSP
jgi:hypothetical protein